MCRDVQDRRHLRRFLTLVGVSAVLHALLFWSLLQREPVVPVHQAMELELAWVDATPATTKEPEPQAAQPQQLPKSTTAKPKKKTAEPSQAVVSTQQESGPSTGSTPSVGERGDLPLATRPSLTPSAGIIFRLGPVSDGEPSRGTTVRNGPGEAPDQRSLDEYTGEVLTRKLNDDLRQEVGLAAVGVGNVPTHFKRYESVMRAALPKSKIDRTPMSTGDVARDVAGVLFNNGTSAEAARKVTDSPLGRSVQNQTAMVPNVEDQRFRESALQLMSQTENLRERASKARLRTVLELTTDATGALADVSIIERSGDARFDESVLHFSRKVARTIPDSDDKLLGTSMWRTRWQFTWEPPEVRVKLLNAWRVVGGPSAQ